MLPRWEHARWRGIKLGLPSANSPWFPMLGDASGNSEDSIKFPRPISTHLNSMTFQLPIIPTARTSCGSVYSCASRIVPALTIIVLTVVSSHCHNLANICSIVVDVRYGRHPRIHYLLNLRIPYRQSWQSWQSI